MGRAYIASCSEDEREAILKTLRSLNTPEGEIARDEARIAHIVQKVRKDGYATLRHQEGYPFRRFAVPIMAPGSVDGVLAAMAMFWYPSVMTLEDATNRHLGNIRQLAEDITVGLRAELACPDSL